MDSILDEFLNEIPHRWGYRRFVEVQKKNLQKRSIELSEDKIYLLSQLLIHLDLETVSNEVLTRLQSLNLNYILCKVRSDAAVYTFSGQHILSEDLLPPGQVQSVREKYLLELGREAPFDADVFVRFIRELVG